MGMLFGSEESNQQQVPASDVAGMYNSNNIFSNNNYLPNLHHYSSPQANIRMNSPVQSSETSTGPMFNLTPPAVGSTFRFMSPSQRGSSIPAWVPSTATSTGLAIAPGMGVNWQHTIPTAMPWMSSMFSGAMQSSYPLITVQSNYPLGAVQPTYASVSTMQSSYPHVSTVQSPGVPLSPQTDLFSIHHISPHETDSSIEPGPKSPPRQLKRRAHPSTTLPEGPSAKKFLSERMATWFKGLSITHNGQQTAGSLGESFSQSIDDHGWQKFRELEKKLEEDLEEGEQEDRSEEKEPLLVLAPGVNKIPISVLPEGILKSINKPCMELILWQPPEEVVNKPMGLVSDTSSNKSENDNSLPLTEEMPPLLHSDTLTGPDNQLMEADLFDSLDDEMDL